MAGSIFVHDFSKYAPDWPLDCGAPSQIYDENLIRRIAAAFRRSIENTGSADDDIWTPIVTMHRPFADMLMSEQYPAANDLLARMFATPLTHGFAQAEELYRQLASSPAHQQHVRLLALDKLLSLAAAVRAIPVQTVEQGDFVPYLKEPPDALLDRIEAKLGRSIDAPVFQGALYGLSTRRGLFAERGLTAIYVALRAQQLVRGIRAPRICEIGGGAGFVAYYCHRLGLRDYTIVDLPTVSAVQAYFLAQNLPAGPAGICLSGEAEAGSEQVKLLGQADLAGGSRKFDLIINVDSFPEMAGPILRDYILFAQQNGRYLLSINQEAMEARSPKPADHQERVGDVVEDIGGLRPLARFPFWMRPGYVEEVYEAVADSSNQPEWAAELERQAAETAAQSRAIDLIRSEFAEFRTAVETALGVGWREIEALKRGRRKRGPRPPP